MFGHDALWVGELCVDRRPVSIFDSLCCFYRYLVTLLFDYVQLGKQIHVVFLNLGLPLLLIKEEGSRLLVVMSLELILSFLV